MTQAFNLSQFANKLNSSGQTDNSGLQNSSVTVTAGTGMSGGGPVALGSSITLNNTGVTSLTAGIGISLSGSTGGVTITNTATSSYVGAKAQVFTSNGTFTIPTGVSALKITVVGGGGGGSGYNASGQVDGKDGGAGGSAMKWLSSLTPGNTLSVVVGSGGSGGGESANGSAGNNSSVSSGTQTITTITGGAGGAGTLSSTGSNGSGTNGDLNGTGNSDYYWAGKGIKGLGAIGAGSGTSGTAGVVVIEW